MDIKTVLVQYSGATPDHMTKRNVNRLKRFAWQELGEWFHKHLMPKRFTQEGARELDYSPRAGEQLGLDRKAFWRSYTGRKLRQKGHTKPLVFSGESEALATRIRDIRATGKGARVINHARKLNFHSRRMSMRMNEEVTRISPREAEQLRHEFNKMLGTQFRSVRRKERRRLK